MPEREHTEILSGFRCVPMLESSLTQLPNVQMGERILMASQFEPWEHFDILANRVHTQTTQHLLLNGCHPNTTGQNRCFGDFRSEHCRHPGCFWMSRYKRNIHDPSFRILVRAQFEDNLLRALPALVKKLCPNWKGKIEVKPDLVNTQIASPCFAIIQPGEENPEALIHLKVPSNIPMLPHLGRHSNLASVYARKRVTEHSELSYDALCMAELIRSALFTRSGCACLFNHNQAVFVKVIPNPIETRTRTRITHTVLVSREFKCQDAISVFHGLLAMMTHGHRVSSIITEIKLRHYFRLLEAAELSSRGGWIVPRTPEGADDDGRFYSVYGGSPRSLGYPETKGKFKIYGEDSRYEMEPWLDLYPQPTRETVRHVERAIWNYQLGEISGTEMTRLFITRSKFSHISESALFMETKIHYMKVFVKTWNRKSKYGLARCLKEILVHKWIAANATDLYSDWIVPHVVGIREEAPQDCALAMHKVGYDLYWFRPATLDRFYGRKGGGDWEEDDLHWFMNGVRLKRDEIEAIEKSATEGLRRLKRIGIIHRNPSPEHLRVQRRHIVENGNSWFTWWVGLGHVTFLDEKKFGDLSYIRSLPITEEYKMSDYWRHYEPVFKLRPPPRQE